MPELIGVWGSSRGPRSSVEAGEGDGGRGRAMGVGWGGRRSSLVPELVDKWRAGGYCRPFGGCGSDAREWGQGSSEGKGERREPA